MPDKTQERQRRSSMMLRGTKKKRERGVINCYMLIPTGMASKQVIALWKNGKSRVLVSVLHKDSAQTQAILKVLFPRLLTLQPFTWTLYPKCMFFSNFFLRAYQTHFLFSIIPYTNQKAFSKLIESLSKVTSKDTNFV